LKYTYLAVPYSHEIEWVRLERYNKVCRAAGVLMLDGEAVFSPISHTHQIGLCINREMDHDFWMRADMPFLAHASELKVLLLTGWDASRGVQFEMKIARQLGIPIHLIGESYIDALAENQRHRAA